MGLILFGHDHDPRGVFIQPVNQAGPFFSANVGEGRPLHVVK